MYLYDAASQYKSRCGNRENLEIEVLLYCHGFPRASTNTINIGLDGMRVNVNPLCVSKNTTVEVEFELGFSQGRTPFRLFVFPGRRQAEISGESCELIFLDYNTEMLSLFRRTVEESNMNDFRQNILAAV